MIDLAGKVALVTGAASGIGLGIARALAGAGARVAVADVRAREVSAAAAALVAERGMALALELDVTDRRAWTRAAEHIERTLGPVDILCSNAGVNFFGPTQTATYEDWDFCLGVNLGGAVNAVRTLVPRMLARGGGGHIVITASVSGLYASGGSGVYNTSKFALVGLAESLRADLAPHRIGVSVLCPGPVKSELFESSAAVRPAALAATGAIALIPPGTAREDTPIFKTALTPEEVGRQVLRGIRRNDMHILTHPEVRQVLEARAAALRAALPDEPVDPERIAATGRLLDTSFYLAETAKPPPRG